MLREGSGICKRVDRECLQPIQPESEALGGEKCWLCSVVRNRVSTRGYTKEHVVGDFCTAWTHAVNQNALIEKLKDENAKLSAKLIKDHEKVIELHREIKRIREQEIEGLKTVVETASHFCKEVAQRSSSSICTSTTYLPTLTTQVMRKVVQDAAETDQKEKNVVVFGLTETPEEDVRHRVDEVLDAVGEKPQFVAERIGRVREGVTRPVLVKLRSGALAAAIRRKADWLKKTDSFKSVFICPDRTIMQRKEHKECVADLRRRCADQPERLHLIRDRMVVFMDKEN